MNEDSTSGRSAPLIACLLWSSIAAGQGFSPAEALARMQVADGLSVRVVASEPMVRQPLAMAFDERGRLWVIQYLQYPNPAGLKATKVDQYLRTVYDKRPEPPPKGPRGADRVTILEDRDGDGRMDRATDFATGLNLATGIAIGYGGVFIVQAPYLLFYPDRNRDDVPDGPPEVLLEGFGLEDAHALANNLIWGPDGWLYGAQGSTVTANIRGVTFQQGIWRYHPRTRRFELFAEGGGNTWGLDFDRHGHAIAGTNFGGAAMLHQVQGGYYIKNFGKHGELQNPHAYGYFDHVPYRGFVGGHVTCGGIIYRGGTLPAKYRDQYVAANLLSNVIDWHVVEPKGSSFANRRGGTLLAAHDTWFRPIDCEIGPDGGVTIADWYDKRANHVDPKDDWDRGNGRIYNVNVPGAPKPNAFDLASLSAPDLVGLLNHANDYYVRTARRILAERRPRQIHAALRWFIADNADHPRALEALWMLYVSGGLDAKFAATALRHPQADIRMWTARLLGDENRLPDELFSAVLELARCDPHASVIGQLASTARRLPGRQALALIAELCRRDEFRDDPHIPLLIWWALEAHALAELPAVLSWLDDPRAWSRPIVQATLVERLGRRFAAEATPAALTACARLLERAPDAASLRRVVQGMDKGLEGRRFAKVPRELSPALPRLAELAGALRWRVALRLGDDSATDRAVQWVADRRHASDERIALIEALGQLKPAAAAATLWPMVGPDEPPAVRKAVLAALARVPDPTLGRRLLPLLADRAADLRKQALQTFCGKPAWASLLLAEVDAGRLAASAVPTEHLRQIMQHQDRRLTALVEKHWGKVQEQSAGAKAARIHGIAVSLGLAKGDASRGKALYKQHCANCHFLFGEGNRVAPELTGADRKDTRFLLTSMVDPSAVIRKEYVAQVVVTTDGQLITGLVADSTPTALTLVTATTQRVTLSRDQIETMKPSPISLMPDNLLDPLDAQQVRDLVRYIQSDGK